jgi:tetratricopeptide (TPR) repeat protein
VKWVATIVTILASAFTTAQKIPAHHSSTELLFVKSNSTSALRASVKELRRDPSDLNAQLIHMEAARLQLLENEELKSAVAILSLTKENDPRAGLAAGRLRELAANTPAFRSVLPRLVELLRVNNPYRQEISGVLLSAASDGLSLPPQTYLTKRLRHWRIAGPFGQLSNVDFDRSWAPENDQLRSSNYEGRFREVVDSESGELRFPDYFPSPGIYYAASDFVTPSAGLYKFTIESPGTFVFQVDDKKLLLHDARFHQQASVNRPEMELGVGKHHVFVKLQLSALPLRVWIEKAQGSNGKVPLVEGVEKSYLEAALSLEDGTFDPALRLPNKSSAISESLRAEALSRAGLDEEAQNSYKAAAEMDPGNLLAEYQLASAAYANQDFDTAVAHLSRVLKAAPAHWPAQDLKYEIADHFDWPREREQALRARLHLHPDCKAFNDAAKFYEDSGEKRRVPYYVSKLSACSPSPYKYWDELSFRGKHEQALASIERYIAKEPNDRNALTAGVREAVLAGKRMAAVRYGRSLGTRAPNFPGVHALAKSPEAILDSRSASSTPLDFYQSFVRNGFAAMAETPIQAADSEVLVNDCVVKLDLRGAWIYRHNVTQLFDKKGIETAGELQLPHSVDVLELRTIKRDGRFVEPEINDNKDTVSMPSLEEGDAVEVSYLQHVNSSSLSATPELLDFVLGSSESPTRSAKLTIIRESGVPEPVLWHSPEVRKISVEHMAGKEITTWESDALSPPPQEPDAPNRERRARVLFLNRGQQPDLLARHREELIDATRITPRIDQIARTIQQPGSREKIAAAYQLVMSTIQNASSSWREGDVTSADQTFEQREGNRAAALISLLSALGFSSDLELAEERSSRNQSDECATARCFIHPLVRVRLGSNETILLDPIVDGLATGAVSPEVEGENAVLISRNDSPAPATLTVPSTTDQRSLAHAELRLDDKGNLSGTIHVRFGSIRGAQMREAWRQVSVQDQRVYLEQIAQRIFPHAREITGSVINQADPEKSLELDLKIEAPGFAQCDGSDLELGQLVPALGLSKLYASLPERHEDLLLEMPLIENSEFVVHLATGMEVKHLPQPVNLRTTFGEYKTKFESGPGILKIGRTFRIPSQIVPPAKYNAFSTFALDIDRAERELIQLHRLSVTQAVNSPSVLTLH